MKHYCLEPNCGRITEGHHYCEQHRVVKERTFKKNSVYDHKWFRFAKDFLKRNPLCAVCGKEAVYCGHLTYSASEMKERFGGNLLEDCHYRPLCSKCSAWDREYNGR